MKLLSFGRFVADPLTGVLRKDAAVVPLTPKAFEVLLALIERRGQVVEKDELLKLIWPDTIVEENNLARHVSTLRKALDDHSPELHYIVTIPGRGYRFVAPVREIIREPEPATEPAQPIVAAGDGLPADAPPPLPAPAPASHVAMRAVAFGLLCVVVLASAAVVALRRPPTLAATPARKLWQLTFDSGLQNEPSWSPDGKRIAYATDRNGNFDIWTQAVSGADPVRVTASSEHDWQPAWSPQGQWIAFRSEREGGGIFVVPATGGAQRRIADFGFKPRWSRDGSKILFNGSYQPTVSAVPTMYVVGLDGGAPKSVFPDLLAKMRGFQAAWHPDSQRVSVYGGPKDGPRSFWTVSLDGTSRVQSEVAPAVAQKMRDTGVQLGAFVWSPKGDALFFEGTSEAVHNLWRVKVDPQTLRWVDGPERLTVGTGLDANIALSPDGLRLAYSSRTERTRLWSFPFDSVAGRLTGPGAPVAAEVTDASYDVSPDGRQLVYRTNRAGTQELWTRSLDSGQDRMLAAGASITVPRWSPDGSRLIFRRETPVERNGNSIERTDVLLAADGGEERLLTTPQAARPDAIGGAPFDWSSDGQRIVTSCLTAPGGPVGICAFPVAGAPHAERDRRLIASNPNLGLYQARFSPDDRWISFNAIERAAGKSVVYIAPVNGGPWIRVTEGRTWEDKPRWSVDGKTIYFASNRGGFINIWGRRFDPLTGVVSGDPFRVTAFETPRQMIFPYLAPLQVVVTKNRLILPVTESFGSIWVLENLDQ